MTMPEFDPVAWRYELKASEYTFAEKRYLNETYAPRPTALHTAGQLAEAYEAGKREASEYIEQAAFEKWLYDKCPPGDVESVQRQWLESYEYAELAGKLEQAAQIEMMREFIARAPVSSGVCCCGESMEGHSSSMNCSHTPVDLWDHSVISVLSATPDQALEQFAERVRDQCDFECYRSNEYGFHRTYLDISNAIRNIKELPK